MLIADTHTPIIVALDDLDDKGIYNLISNVLDPNKHRVKIGMEMFTRYGPEIIQHVKASGYEVMLDLKYFDIPRTAARAAIAAAELGVWMFTIHALGGGTMINKVMEALVSDIDNRPLVVGITILTSYNRKEMNTVGINGPVEDSVVRLAMQAQHNGLDGVVCSPKELGILRSKLVSNMLIVTPGIRLPGVLVKDDDQQRFTSPRDAIANGANYIVVGSPITKAEHPAAALFVIEREIDTPEPLIHTRDED